MSKRLIAFLGTTLLLFALTAAAVGQVRTTTVTKVQNPDGTYTIVEYPVGKETVVALNPVGINATGTATILRKADGTTIRLNLTSVPADVAGLNLYAVDPTGAVSMLGPIDIANGVGTFTTTVPMTRFMLFASPDADVAAYDPNTRVFFRSAVPSGLAVIPLGQNTAVGEQVAVTAGLSGAGGATCVVLVSGATEVSRSLISLFSPNLDPVMSFGLAGVPISPVSLMPAP